MRQRVRALQRCEGRDLFGKRGSGQCVSGWQSIAGEIPLRSLAAHDEGCMDPRAEADWSVRVEVE
eukprot:COSAG02_NODE_1797_length_10902_cov_25.030177_2_plen_65_part_00